MVIASKDFPFFGKPRKITKVPVPFASLPCPTTEIQHIPIQSFIYSQSVQNMESTIQGHHGTLIILDKN